MSTPIPVINSVTPSSGPTAGGTSVTITGQNFRNGCRVRVGGVDSPQVTFINSTQVIAVTPAGTAGPATVRVINPNQQTPGIAQDAFTYVNAPPPPTPPVPTVTSVQPPSGPTSGGTQVTITGQNFVLGCQAKFGGTDAQTTFISSSQLSAVTPAGAAGPATVRGLNPGQSQAGILQNAFQYVTAPPPPPAPQPVINTVQPSSGSTAGGTPVTITGQNFVFGCQVKFGGNSAQTTFISSSQVSAVAPPAQTAGAVTVRVVNPDSQQQPAVAQNAFNYIAPPPAPQPVISSLNPPSGPLSGGTQVTIAGQNFAPGCEVKFGGNPAQVLTNSPTLLQVLTPQGSAAGPITVRVINPGQQPAIAQNAFSYNAPPPPPMPTITSVTPASGPTAGGTPVSIFGQNFLPNCQVKFGGVPAQVTQFTPTRLNVVAPPAQAEGPATVRVINPGQEPAVAQNAFTYLAPPPPVITSVTPSTGPTGGGTPVTIDGQNFAPNCQVKFEGNLATITSNSPARLNVLTPPAQAAGPATVRVINPNQPPAVRQNGFNYTAPPPPPPPPQPVISSLNPPRGPVAGGTGVVITGQNFRPGCQVKFGGADAQTTFVNETRLNVVTPPGQAGPVNVRVINPGQQPVVAQNAFTYLAPPPPPPPAPAPVVSSVSPASGPLPGGTMVSVMGANFQNGSRAMFGGKDAQTAFVSATRLDVTTPSQTTAGAVRVRVVNPDGQAGSRDNAYEYTSQPTPGPGPGPRITKVEPARGPLAGGTPITVTGENFVSGCALRVGGADARKLRFVDSTKLTAETPPQTDAGAKNLRVVNPDGKNFVFEGGFTYDAPPVLREVSPNAGPFEQDPNRPQLASLLGAFFEPGAVVLFGAKQAKVLKVTPGQIDVEVPIPLAKGAVAVTVRNTDGQESVLQAGFTYLGRNQAKRPRITKITPLTVLEGTDTPVTVKGLNLKQAFDQGLIVVRGPDPNVARITISGDGAEPGGATLEDTVTFMLRVDVPNGLGLAEQLPLVVAASLRPNAAEDLLLEGNSVMLSTVSKTLPVPLGFTANVTEGGPNLLMMVGRNLANTRLEVWRGNTQLDLSQQQADDEVVFGILPLEGGQTGPLQLRLMRATGGGNPLGTYNLKLRAPSDIQALAAADSSEDGAGFELQPTGMQFLVGSPTGQMSAVRVNAKGGSRNLAVSKPVLDSKRLKPGVGLQLFTTGFELALFDRAVILPAFSRPKPGLVDFSPVNVRVGVIFGLRALSLLLFVRVTLEVQTTLALVPVLDPFNDVFFPDPFNDFSDQLPDPFAGFPGAFVFDLVVFTSVSLNVIFVLGLVKPKQPGQSREQIQTLVEAGIGVTVGDGGITLDGGVSFGARINKVRPLGGTPKVRHLASLKPVPDEAGFRGFYFAERTGRACLPFEFDVTLFRKELAAAAPVESTFVYSVVFCTDIVDGPRDGFFIEPGSLTFANGDPPATVRARLVSNNDPLKVPEQVMFTRVGPAVASVQEVNAADNALVTPDPALTGLCQVRAMLVGRGPERLALLPSPDLKFEVEQLVYTGGLPQGFKEINATVLAADVKVEFALVGPDGKEQPLPAAPKMLRVGVPGNSTDDKVLRRRRQTIVAKVTPKAEVGRVKIDGGKRLLIEEVGTDSREGLVIFRVMGARSEMNDYPTAPAEFKATHTPSGKDFKYSNVAVVVPTKIQQPFDTKSGPASFKRKTDEGADSINFALNDRTFPIDPAAKFPEFNLLTYYGHALKITVLDQFDQPCGDLYEGAPIDEKKPPSAADFSPINQTLTAQSTYDDPVGFLVGREGSPELVRMESDRYKEWLRFKEPQRKLGDGSGVQQNIRVFVDRFELLPAPAIRNRVLTRRSPDIVNINYFETGAPNAPTDLKATLLDPQGRPTASLTWLDKSDNETGFSVGSMFMRIDKDFVQDPPVKPNVTTAMSGFLTPGASYAFRVLALGELFNSDPSNVVTVFVPLRDPNRLTATPVGKKIRLDWQQNGYCDGFIIERKVEQGGFTFLVRTRTPEGDFPTTTYEDENVEAGKTYTYHLKAFAVKPDGTTVESAFTEDATAKANAAPQQVAITGVTPPAAAPGTEVTVTGTGLGGATAVKLGDATVAPRGVTPDGSSFKFTVPQGAAGGTITVTTPTGTASAPFSVLAPEIKLSVNPPAQRVTGGQVVNFNVGVSRTNFNGPVNLSVGGLPPGANATISPNPVNGSATLSVSTAANTPAGTSAITVSASATGVSVAPVGVSLTVETPAPPPPSISNFFPAAGPVGTQVSVFGAAFVNVASVRFGAADAAFGVISPNQITATVPPGATTGPITLITSSGSAQSPAPFNVLAPKGKDTKDVKDKEVKERESKRIKEVPEGGRGGFGGFGGLGGLRGVPGVEPGSGSAEDLSAQGRSFINPEERPEVGRRALNSTPRLPGEGEQG